MTTSKKSVTLRAVSRNLIFEQSRKDGKGSFYNFYFPEYGSIPLSKERIRPAKNARGYEIRGHVDIFLGFEGEERLVSIPHPELKGYYIRTYLPVEQIAKYWEISQKRYLEKFNFDKEKLDYYKTM